VSFPTPVATARMFPDLATVESRSVTQDDEGEQIESWGTRHSDIPCQFAALVPASPRESELRQSDQITELGTRRAFLLGDWSDITESDRLVITGRGTYDIRGIERDSWAIVTVLRLEDIAEEAS